MPKSLPLISSPASLPNCSGRGCLFCCSHYLILFTFSLLLFLLFHLSNHFLGWLGTLPEFIYPRVVRLIYVPLPQKDKEDSIIPQAGKSVHDWHFDDECEQIIDKCIDRFVRHCPPIQMRHALELVIDE